MTAKWFQTISEEEIEQLLRNKSSMWALMKFQHLWFELTFMIWINIYDLN